MKKISLLIMLGFLTWACANTSANSDESTASADTEAKAEGPDGEAIYKTYCVNCHGLQGDMGGAGAYNLRMSELSLEERMQVIKNGRGMMAALGSLMSEEEIRAVAQYTFKLKD